MSDKTLTADEVAVILKCSSRHVKKLLTDKELRGRKIANKWVITQGAVDEFLKGEK